MAELAGAQDARDWRGFVREHLATRGRVRIVGFIVMPTSVHLPQALLQAVDRKAKALRMSRNQFVIRALQKEVDASEWSAGFFERLAPDAETNKAIGEMLVAIRKGRRSKPARRF